jgi:hypothetical protein
MISAHPPHRLEETTPPGASPRIDLPDWESLAVGTILAVAVAFNLFRLYPEVVVKTPKLNDGVMHLLALQQAVTALASGQDPTDLWVAPIAMGYPLFHYYQHLPYVLPAALYVLTSSVLPVPLQIAGLFDWTGYLLLSAFPLSIYWSMRRFGFARLPSALTSLAAPLIATDGLFGFDFNSYVWIGYGLYTQLWGMLLLPPALAQGYAVLRDGRGYFWAVLLLAATSLSHLAFGYVALASLIALTFFASPRREPWSSLKRLAPLLLAVALVSSYFLVPLVLDSAYLNRSVWDRQDKYDSYGHEWVLGMLARGELFDHGRFPSLTILAGVGLAACLYRWREQQYRVPLVLSVLWLLLYFGRPTWGFLLDITPLSRDLYLHRLIAGVHLGGIYLIGLGLAVPLSWASARKRTHLLIVPIILTVLLLLPVYRERVAYLETNARLMMESRDAHAADREHIAALVEWLKAAPPGRVYAGLAGTWGKQYQVGGAQMYGLLTQAGIDTLGFLYHPWSLNGDVQVLFDERRPEQYNLFNIRYVVAPVDRALPDFVRPLRDFGRHRLYQVDTTGYLDLVGSDLSFVGGKGDFYAAASRWLGSDQPRVKQHPSLLFGGAKPDYRRTFPLSEAVTLTPRDVLPTEAPRGRVVAETIKSNAYLAEVEVERESTLMLKATYHPNWHAYVDGLETTTVMLMPSYVGVQVAPGRHQVRLEYRPQPLRGYLMILGLLTLVLVALAEWRPATLAPVTRPSLKAVWFTRRRPVLGAASWAPLLAIKERLGAQLPYLAGVALVALLSGLPLLQLKLMSGHDHLEYLPRNVEFWRALMDGQLLPRWAPDLSGGHGEPFFSFNPPVIYYLSALFHALRFSFVASENLACLVLLLLAGLGMYLLAGDFIGPRGGLVSATAYLFAPYLHSRLYVSHALADFSAFAPLPLAFWGLHRFAEGGRYRFLLAGSLSMALLQLSSNPAALMTFAALGLLLVWLAWGQRSSRLLLRGAWCLALGLGLSAFFWLPALVERDLVHTHRLLESFLNYRNHFAYLHQLVWSSWGYGVSVPGPRDGMSFAVGSVHLALAAVSLLLIRPINAASKRAGQMVTFCLVLLMLGVFFSIYESQFLWDRLALLQYLEYPWRFLTLVALSTAFLCGSPLLLLAPGQYRLANGLAAVLIGGLLLFNFSHARPEKFTEVTDADFTPEKIAGRYIAVTTAREYEPIWVSERPSTPAREPVAFVAGQGRVAVTKRSPTELEFRAQIADEARLRINTFYFPGWTLSVNGITRPIDRSSSQGVMELSLEQGDHWVWLTFGDTPVRLWSARLSLLALLLLLVTPWLGRWKQTYNSRATISGADGLSACQVWQRISRRRLGSS